MGRYYGWYSNKMRGVRQCGLSPERVVRRPGGALRSPSAQHAHAQRPNTAQDTFQF